SETPLVWGGVHVTLLPEQSLESPYCDVVVRGEGEITVRELAGKLQNNEDLSGVRGITFKKGNQIISNPDRDFMDMDEIDVELPYDLVEMDKYSISSFPVHTSRGCPFRCGFCYNTAFNKRSWRYKSAIHVVDEIEYVVKKFGVKEISFTWEDEFFINVKRVKKFCEELIRRNIKVKWNAFCHPNTFSKVNAELLELLENAGCDNLSLGGESGSQRVLDEIIKKDNKIETLLKATETLSKTKIRQIVSFMSGMPTETESDLQLTLKLIDKLSRINPNIYVNGIFLYTPYPGTPMFDLVVEQYGYEIPDSLDKWAEFGIYRNVGNINWQPPHYIEKCKTISILTRFPFLKKEFSFNDISGGIAGERFNKFPFNLAYYFFAKDAVFRWKHRLFKFSYEWKLLEQGLEKLRGFV
ncbi:MAG: B12-binding domain-containing radical SAM protein, partial [Nitrospinales bacterium]